MNHAAFLVPHGLVLLSSLGLAQESGQASAVTSTDVPSLGPDAWASESALVPVTFEGFVFEPDGAPAEGAVVVSSAGGKAVADRSGRFRLEARVPLDAESVQVTAVGRAGRNLVASTSVALNAPLAQAQVGPLLLSQGGTCSPSWLPTFGGPLGTNGTVFALAVHDDGSGPQIYAGGIFTTAGGVAANRIAKWDGSSWAALGSGMNDIVRALTVYDDGGGPELYAGGNFTSAGGVAANRIAKWDGSSWAPLGSGLNNDVRALTVYDDGGGPELYAGGDFTSAGGVAANRIAKWDGSSWAPLGSGLNNDVRALTVYDDGGGPELYAGGDFTSAGGVAANRIAKWDGSSWAPLGSGLNNDVRALTVYDDGGGPELYAGGDFTSAGGVAANRIAKWDGSSWAPLGSGVNGPGTVAALTVYDDGRGPELYAGGVFGTAGGVAVGNIAKWDGSSWAALGSGLNGEVRALTVYDDGGGPELYAGGNFTSAGGVAANRIAKWDGSSWASLGSGMNNTVHALTVYDDGGGDALYAVGDFTYSIDSGDSYLAKWGFAPDTTPPTLSCPPYVFVIEVFGSPPGEVVTFSVTATDCDPAPTVVCVPPSGSFFPRGTTLVTCTATDDSGNQSTCVFPVTVPRR
mgnify:CR=1 FL=1